jgi:hypothetical protein
MLNTLTQPRLGKLFVVEDRRSGKTTQLGSRSG